MAHKTSNATKAVVAVVVVVVIAAAVVGILAGVGVIGPKSKAPPAPKQSASAMAAVAAARRRMQNGSAASASASNVAPMGSAGNGSAMARAGTSDGSPTYPSQLNTQNGAANPYFGGQFSKHDASMSKAPGQQGCNTTLPMGFYPFSQNVAAAYDRQWPDMQDPSSLQKGVNMPLGQQQFCGGGGAPNKGFLDMNTLMPAEWRASDESTGGGCAGNASALGAQTWSSYAPSRAAFNQYVTAAGSARLGVNTRSKNPGGGVRNLLRSPTAVPITAASILFNDSDQRQSAIQNSTGMYPTTTYC